MAKEDTGANALMVNFENFLTERKDQLAAALGERIGADRMTRLALTAFANSTDLQECSKSSIWASILTASQLRLEIGVGGQGWLIPYKGVCTFQPGWRGLADIAGRYGSLVWTGCVYEGDDFKHILGTNPRIEHVRARQGKKSDREIIATYAVAEVNGHTRPVMEVMWIEELEEHFKKINKVGNRHYRYKHEEMYFRKVPLLQVCKYLPQSKELTNAMEAAYAAENFDNVTFDAKGHIIRTPNPDFMQGDGADDERSEAIREPQRRPTRDNSAASDAQPREDRHASYDRHETDGDRTESRNSREPEREERREEPRQPQRRAAAKRQEPEQRQERRAEPQDSGELASDGEVAYIRRKLGDQYETMAAAFGIDSVNLTKAGFAKLKAAKP